MEKKKNKEKWRKDVRKKKEAELVLPPESEEIVVFVC